MAACAPHSLEDDVNPRYLEAVRQKGYVEYLLDILIHGDSEEKDSLCSEPNPDIRKIQCRLTQLKHEKKQLDIDQ